MRAPNFLSWQVPFKNNTKHHIWWTCPVARRLWIRVFNLLRTLTSLTLPRVPSEALLNKPILNASKWHRLLIGHIFTATKLIIAKSWKSPSLSFEAVKQKIQWILINEKLTAILNDTHPRFLKIWQPWISYFQPSRFDPALLTLQNKLKLYIIQTPSVALPSFCSFPLLSLPFPTLSQFFGLLLLLSSPGCLRMAPIGQASQGGYPVLALCMDGSS